MMTNKTEQAIEMVNLFIRHGWEFPDACSRAATTYRVDYDALRRAYDDQFETNGRTQ